MSIRARTCLLALITLVALPMSSASARSPARASIDSKVLDAYQRYGMIPPCKFTSRQLERTLKRVDTYSAQYAADFPIAIENARLAQASGACQPTNGSTVAGAVKAPSLSGGGPSGGGGAPAGGASVPVVPVTGATSAALPIPMVLMAVFAAALVLLGAGLALTRIRVWDPGWALEWRHAWSEAGYRLGGAWETCADRLRHRR